MGRRLKKSFVKLGGVGILSILILLGLLMPALSVNGYDFMEEKGYISHAPFRINSNSELQNMAATEGWSGSGSLFDPYIIEKYEINASGYSYGIYIGNTTLQFTIKNCLIYNVQNSSGNAYFRGAGILLTNVTYGSVVNNILHFHLYGISIVDSSIIYLSDNEVYENQEGIEVTSDYISLYDNQIYDNDFYGIIIYEHSHNTITNNTLTNNSIEIYGSTSALHSQDNDFKKNKIYHSGFVFFGGLETYTFQNIDTSNTVNDKPVYYYKNYTGNSATISPDVGQIILANTTDLTLSNVHITNTSDAILIGYSSQINIEDSNLSSNTYGVYIYDSSNINILNSNLSHNWNGIYMYGSSSINMRNNLILESRGSGILVDHSQYATVSSNNCSENNGAGIELSYSNNNKIENNLCNHSSEGIYTRYGNNNIVMNNSCNHNFLSGIEIYKGDNNDISENLCTHDSNGIVIDHSKQNKIYNNEIYFNGGFLFSGGIVTYVGAENIIRNNILANNTDSIYLSYENGTSIYSNNINSSTDRGIFVKHSINLNIYFNKIGNSTGYGISLQGSKRIRIYENKFYYNHGSGDDYDSSHIQAYDDGANYWNGTAKGNYWQDWRGPDDDNDGIVDEPYIIDGPSSSKNSPGNSKDFYPIAGVYTPEFTYLLPILIALIASFIIIKKKNTY